MTEHLTSAHLDEMTDRLVDYVCVADAERQAALIAMALELLRLQCAIAQRMPHEADAGWWHKTMAGLEPGRPCCHEKELRQVKAVLQDIRAAEPDRCAAARETKLREGLERMIAHWRDPASPVRQLRALLEGTE